jgi:hypothetical protein
MKLFGVVTIVVIVLMMIGCDDKTSNPEHEFSCTQRTSGYFDFTPDLQEFVIKNAIGFIYLNGSNDSTRINYVLDKKVLVKETSSAQSELNKIELDHSESIDTLFSSINFPAVPIGKYYCTMNLDVPNKKNIVINYPNDGVYTSYLESNLFVETKNESCTVESHNGSLEVHSNGGNIVSVLGIPDSGFCKCYSVSGNINIKIPIGSNANIHLKSVTGTVSFNNLAITTSTNTSKEIIGTLGIINSNTPTIYLESTGGNVSLVGF